MAQTYEDLIAHYVATLPKKLAALDRAIRSAREGDTSGLAEAREFVHRMRGTAGSYGFPELSVAATSLDDALKAFEGGRGWTEAERCSALVQTIGTQITQAHSR
jgi:HPt (histidine-containing phosphotransfer) domain-containing protein